MKTPVEKSSVAERDFASVIRYFLDQDAVDAGLRFADRFDETLEKIANFPDLGSPWECDNPRFRSIRYWPVKGFENYLVFYRRFEKGIVITHVLHASQDLNRLL